MARHVARHQSVISWSLVLADDAVEICEGGFANHEKTACPAARHIGNNRSHFYTK